MTIYISRYLQPLLFIAFVVVISHATSAIAASPEIAADESIQRGIEARQAIDAGKIHWVLKHPKVTPSFHNYARVTREYSIAFSKNLSEFKAVVEWQGPKAEWQQQTLRNKDVGAYYDRGSWSPHAQMSSDQDNPELAKTVFNPRLLGWIPQRLSSMPTESVQEVIQRLYIANGTATIREGKRHGKKVHIITLQPNASCECTIVLAPFLDYNPLKVRIQRERVTAVVESEYGKFEYSGHSNDHAIWFPTSVIFSEFKEGELVAQDSIEVQSAVFSPHLASQEFHLASLDIRPGRRIIGDRGQAFVAPDDSGTIRPASSNDVLDSASGDYVTPESAVRSTVSSTHGNINWSLWINVAVVIMLSVSVLMVWLRR